MVSICHPEGFQWNLNYEVMVKIHGRGFWRRVLLRSSELGFRMMMGICQHIWTESINNQETEPALSVFMQILLLGTSSYVRVAMSLVSNNANTHI